ncbi:hypothetical protein ACWCQ1_09575 [Streptomyces sp. NPDC002144]|uniref:hypothetical protein n=1 Tax=Streptomyces sp. NPDC006668 TaxID=3156903 RepID=UPI0033F07733
MNVLICAVRGARPTEPPCALPDVPPRPERDGGKYPDGPRPAPATVRRGGPYEAPSLSGAVRVAAV